MSDEEHSQEIDFLEDGPWDELYVLTEHWQSDLEFYRDDLRFLHHLIDKYFIWITRQENLDRVRKLKTALQKITAKAKDLLEKVGKHRVQIGYLVVDTSQADAGIIEMEHEHLEEEIAQFVKAFRENRKEIFAMTEYVIDSEELAHIMDN